jgi:hypothetical protein
VITPKPPPPFSKVTFFDGGTSIGTASVVEGTNSLTAFLITYQIKDGPATGEGSVNHNIKAQYGSQTSTIIKLKVFPSKTKTTITTALKASYEIGETVTLNAVVTRVTGPTAGPQVTSFQWKNLDTQTDLPCNPHPNNPLTCTFKISAPTGNLRVIGIYPGDTVEFGGSDNSKTLLRVCQSTFADCDGDKICETNLATSNLHCGDCNTPCSLPNANAQCVSSSCQIQSCTTGFRNCDDAAPGCEFTCGSLTTIENINVTLSEYPSTQLCPDAVSNLTQGSLPRFGTGNLNGNWIRSLTSGVELAIRTEERSLGLYTPNGGNAKVYSTLACESHNSAGNRSRWNYGISIDLRNATGLYAGKLLGDYNASVKFEVLFNSINVTGFPIFSSVLDLSASNIGDICTKCSSTFPTQINGEDVGGMVTDPTTQCPTIAKNFAGKLKFFQESSNIMFIPNITQTHFDYKKPALLQVTLSLSPKDSSCSGTRCALSVSMLVLVNAVDPCPS